MVIELILSVGDDAGRGVLKFDWTVDDDVDGSDERELLMTPFVATAS